MWELERDKEGERERDMRRVETEMHLIDRSH